MSAAAILSSIMSSSGNLLVNPEYTLMDPGDINANVKMIGDRIVEKINKEYINNNPNDTPEKIEAQVKNDLLKIYYSDSGNRVVRPSMLKHFCNTWYNALKIRNETIIKELVKYMKTHADQNQVQNDRDQEEEAINDKPDDKSNIDVLTAEAIALSIINKSQPKSIESEDEIESDEEKSDYVLNKQTEQDKLPNKNNNQIVDSKSSHNIGFGIGLEDISPSFDSNPNEVRLGQSTKGSNGNLKEGGGLTDLANAAIKEGATNAIKKGAPKGLTDGIPKLASNASGLPVGGLPVGGLDELSGVLSGEMPSGIEGMPGANAIGTAAAGLATGMGDAPSAETEKKNSILLNKLIEYKVNLFKSENFEKSKPLKRSATVSQVYDLHEKLITKILCNYAAIDRSILMGELRKIILGEDVMKEIEDYERKRRWIKTKPKEEEEEEPISNGPRSIYHLFMDRLELLSDIENYNEPSESIVRKKEPTGQTGGDDPETLPPKKIPTFIPSTYVWEKIKKYVETQIQVAIHHKLVLNKENTDSIQNAFKDVFIQSNCDSIDLESTKNEQMTEYFNNEYRALLNALCVNIPINYAAPILRNYVLRNFTDLSDFLTTALSANANQVETYLLGAFNYNSVVSKVVEDESIQPEYPELERIKKYPNDIGKLGSLDDSCNERKADKGLDSYGVSEFLKVENITSERSVEDYVTPSILLPAFDVYKEEFNQCTENMEFLKNLFNMYSARSIKFMHHIRAQFEDDKTNDFIERYIITKHTYTMNILTECIRHATDIKVTLLNNFRKDASEEEQLQNNEELTRNLSYYTAYLLYLASDTNINVEKIGSIPHIDFITSGIDDFINQIKVDVNTEEIRKSIISIIDNIPANEMPDYDGSIENVLVANKQTIMPRITRKRLGKKPNNRKTVSNKGTRLDTNIATNIAVGISDLASGGIPFA